MLTRRTRLQIVAFFVMSPIGWLNSLHTSMIERVILSSRSIGW